MNIYEAARLLNMIERDPPMSQAKARYDELRELCGDILREWGDANDRAGELEQERDALQEKLDAAGGVE